MLVFVRKFCVYLVGMGGVSAVIARGGGLVGVPPPPYPPIFLFPLD